MDVEADCWPEDLPAVKENYQNGHSKAGGKESTTMKWTPGPGQRIEGKSRLVALTSGFEKQY